MKMKKFLTQTHVCVGVAPFDMYGDDDEGIARRIARLIHLQTGSQTKVISTEDAGYAGYAVWAEKEYEETAGALARGYFAAVRDLS